MGGAREPGIITYCYSSEDSTINCTTAPGRHPTVAPAQDIADAAVAQAHHTPVAAETQAQDISDVTE